MIIWIKNLVTIIPMIIDVVKRLYSAYLSWKKAKEEAENESIRRQVENAKTPEERQQALDRLARRLSRK